MVKPAPVQVVLFDIDGTLVDTVDLHAEAWQRAFARFGREVPFDEVRSQIGKGGDQLLPVFLSKAEVAKIGEELEGYRAKLYREEYLPRARAMPKVRDLFERLRDLGMRIGLASSCKKDELDTYTALCRIEDLIEDATTADDAERSKPHPDIFEAALASVGGAKPADALVVGDSPYDAIAAGKAGIRTVGLLCGGFPVANLTGAGCIAIFGSPADLLERIDELPLDPAAREAHEGSHRGAA